MKSMVNPQVRHYTDGFDGVLYLFQLILEFLYVLLHVLQGGVVRLAYHPFVVYYLFRFYSL